MAKTATKKREQQKSSEKFCSHTKKEGNGFKIKNLVVNLVRLSKQEIEKMTSEVQISAETVTHTIPIKISERESNVNGVSIKMDGAVQSVFNIGLKVKTDKIIIQACENIANIVEQKSTKSNPTVKTLTQLINEEWRRCKRTFKEKKIIFKVDTVVMAQMKGYSPWPSLVSDINKNGKRVKVFFFGTSNTGTVDSSEIVPMEQCSEIIRLLLLRKTIDFAKGVREAELSLGIPVEKSAVKSTQEIE